MSRIDMDEAATTPLSEDEAALFEQCQAAIGRGHKSFGPMCEALATIRDGRLYREKYPTFAAYCQGEWGIGKSHAYRLIEAGLLADQYPELNIRNENEARKLIERAKRGDLSPIGDIMGSKTLGNQQNLPPEETEKQRKQREADVRRRADIEALASCEFDSLSDEMRDSVCKAATRLCRIEHKGISPAAAQPLLPAYQELICSRLSEIAPGFVKALDEDGMKPGRAVAGLMGELNKGMPRAPVNHASNVENSLKKQITSLHLYAEFEPFRQQRMEGWLAKLAKTYPPSWRKILMEVWRG